MSKFPEKSLDGNPIKIYEEIDGVLIGAILARNEWFGCSWDAKTGNNRQSAFNNNIKIGKEKCVGWLNIYQEEDGIFEVDFYDSLDKARIADLGTFARIGIIVEEGEGL